MQDVSIRRMVATSVIAAAVALLVVGGALLFGMGKPAQAQETPPPCNTDLCVDKTASPSTVNGGEQITFTITQRCPEAEACLDSFPLVDQLPSGLTVDSVVDSAPNIQCTTSGTTVTCPGIRTITPTAPFTLTIVATPTECGSFTNSAGSTASGLNPGSATYTVEGCPPQLPTTKEQCKKGGWKEFG
jgi:hypothetical protein